MNAKNVRKSVTGFLRRLLVAPFALCAVLDNDETELLLKAVEKRTARAEAAVLRDFFAQRGLEGEQLEQAEEQFRQIRREREPDAGQLEQLRLMAQNAEEKARKAQVSAEARVQMARLGIPERHSADVLLLASRELEQAEKDGGDSEAVRHALEAVVARLPGLAEPSGSPSGTTAGAKGNFPRQNDAASVMQSSLDRARAAGDNATAVGIITAAAQKGITLR